MRVEEMVERVWPGREATIEVLGGGITNRNFKVTLDDGAYVLRIGGKDTELLGIDRRVEHEASLAAAAVGVGPEVVAFIEPEGYLVTRFIGGARGRARGDSGRPRRSAASRSPCVRCTTGRRSRRVSTRSACRGVRGDCRDERDRGPGALRAGSRDRRARPARAWERARASVPQRPPDGQFHRRRQPHPHRRLGVRGHGRRLLRPGQLRGQQRALRRGDRSSSCAHTSETYAPSTSARCC